MTSFSQRSLIIHQNGVLSVRKILILFMTCCYCCIMKSSAFSISSFTNSKSSVSFATPATTTLTFGGERRGGRQGSHNFAKSIACDMAISMDNEDNDDDKDVTTMTRQNTDCKTTSDHTTTTTTISRRKMFQTFLATGAAMTTTTTVLPMLALAEETTTTTTDNSNKDNEMIQVYFGCGCFWHVQHEFVEAERRILGRTDDLTLTARAGYAGGKGGMKDDKVCYHNAAQISDYGSLGHAEVVKLDIPASSFYDFCLEYFYLFNKDGYRPDQFQDRGLEYRNIVGIPGGVSSKYAKVLVDASKASGDKLDFAKGKGNDPDRRALAFVMDTNEFPFYVAEQYHQFHDGFNLGENYPNSYNNIANKLAKNGTLGVSKCPNGLLGIGALGL